MDSALAGRYDFLTTTLIKLAVQASINQIARLPIDKAVKVVMQKLTKLVSGEKNNL